MDKGQMKSDANKNYILIGVSVQTTKFATRNPGLRIHWDILQVVIVAMLSGNGILLKEK
jgi:hypothetical protein